MKYIARDTKGFTLIELMIVIAIVSILVALAVPAYKNYVIRTKVTECINNASTVKLVISEYRQSVTPVSWPDSEDVAGTAPPNGDSRFCNAFVNYTAATGSFEIDVDETEVGALASPIQPRLTPTDNGEGTVSWFCSRGATAVAAIQFLPSPCQSANP
jgi:type IV pilus assembly protein PilA